MVSIFTWIGSDTVTVGDGGVNERKAKVVGKEVNGMKSDEERRTTQLKAHSSTEWLG